MFEFLKKKKKTEESVSPIVPAAERRRTRAIELLEGEFLDEMGIGEDRLYDAIAEMLYQCYRDFQDDKIEIDISERNWSLISGLFKPGHVSEDETGFYLYSSDTLSSIERVEILKKEDEDGKVKTTGLFKVEYILPHEPHTAENEHKTIYCDIFGHLYKFPGEYTLGDHEKVQAYVKYIQSGDLDEIPLKYFEDIKFWRAIVRNEKKVLEVKKRDMKVISEDTIKQLEDENEYRIQKLKDLIMKADEEKEKRLVKEEKMEKEKKELRSAIDRIKFEL